MGRVVVLNSGRIRAVGTARWIRPVVAVTLCFGACMVLLAAGANLLVVVSTRPWRVPADKVEPAQAAIVLGAKVLPGGVLSSMLEDRMLTGIELYRAGKVKKLLLSGDHGRVGYDEVNAMKAFAMEHGVQEEDIFMDHAGFSTYESMYRARDVFKVRSAVVVTQGFHLPRAVFCARGLGIEVRGVAADLRPYPSSERFVLRELAARVKSAVDLYALKRRPKYLGEPIPITGDGRATQD